MRRVVVQDQPDRTIRRIVSIQILEQGDELHASVPLLDARGDVPVMQVQRCQDRPRAIADVLMIAGYRGIMGDERFIGAGVLPTARDIGKLVLPVTKAIGQWRPNRLTSRW